VGRVTGHGASPRRGAACRAATARVTAGGAATRARTSVQAAPESERQKAAIVACGNFIGATPTKPRHIPYEFWSGIAGG
jgi:hypothetical protein